MLTTYEEFLTQYTKIVTIIMLLEELSIAQDMIDIKNFIDNKHSFVVETNDTQDITDNENDKEDAYINIGEAQYFDFYALEAVDLNEESEYECRDFCLSPLIKKETHYDELTHPYFTNIKIRKVNYKN